MLHIAPFRTAAADIYSHPGYSYGKGAAAIAAGLKQNVSLRMLELGQNALWDAGVIEIARVLAADGALEDVGLTMNNFGAKGVAA